MSGQLRYSSTLKFNSNLDDLISDWQPPSLDDYTDKVILPPSVLDQIISEQSSLGLKSLPSPIIFKLSTISGKKVCHVGVREFTSEEDYIIMPRVIQEKLGVYQSIEEVSLRVTLEADIPKGSALVLKPLDPAYDIDDWKFFLEAQLTRKYTTLTEQDILYIEDKRQIYKLLIDKVEPEPTVSIVDTDIDLAVHPLNDDHAKVMLEKRSRQKEILDLERAITVTTLQVRDDSLKIHCSPVGKSTFYVQIQVKDKEFDVKYIDLFASTDKYLDKDTFRWSTLNSIDTVKKNDIVQLKIDLTMVDSGNDIYIVPYLWKSATVFDILMVSKEEDILRDIPKIDSSEDGKVICSNCTAQVPKGSIILHENFCLRNNVKCPDCQTIFHKHIPESHWHCKYICSAHGDDEGSYEHHVSLFHYKHECECGRSFENLPSLAFHRDVECGTHLHECRFCHLVVPRGDSTAIDVFMQLSHHESDCGSKTYDCEICRKPVMLKDLESHMKLHDMDRASKDEPVKCANINCVRTVKSDDHFGLCDVCFAPSFSNVFDPTNVKLQSRFERRYVIQLSKGCGNSWCKNPSCKSSGLSSFNSMADVIKHVKDDLLTSIPNVPITDSKPIDNPSYEFCVDSSTTRKKLLADWIFEEGEYSFNWCCEGVNQSTDEQGVKHWLSVNGVKLVERK